MKDGSMHKGWFAVSVSVCSSHGLEVSQIVKRARRRHGGESLTFHLNGATPSLDGTRPPHVNIKCVLKFLYICYVGYLYKDSLAAAAPAI